MNEITELISMELGGGSLPDEQSGVIEQNR